MTITFLYSLLCLQTATPCNRVDVVRILDGSMVNGYVSHWLFEKKVSNEQLLIMHFYFLDPYF